MDDLPKTEIWHVTWGPSVDFSWKGRIKVRLRMRLERVRDAVAVLSGQKIAVDADEYYEVF